MRDVGACWRCRKYKKSVGTFLFQDESMLSLCSAMAMASAPHARSLTSKCGLLNLDVAESV